jgi:hypothetical protein
MSIPFQSLSFNLSIIIFHHFLQCFHHFIFCPLLTVLHFFSNNTFPLPVVYSFHPRRLEEVLSLNEINKPCCQDISWHLILCQSNDIMCYVLEHWVWSNFTFTCKSFNSWNPFISSVFSVSDLVLGVHGLYFYSTWSNDSCAIVVNNIKNVWCHFLLHFL